MIAIILSAGMGRRLHPISDEIPKSLIVIGNRTILERLILQCKNCGIESFIVVAGYNIEKIDKFCRDLSQYHNIKIKIVENINFQKTNTGYSLYLGLNDIHSDVIIINGDNLLDQRIISLLIKDFDTAMVIDKKKKLTRESYKIIINKNNIIQSMGKQIDLKISTGEFIGVSKIKCFDIVKFKEILYSLIQKNIMNYYDDAFIELSRYVKINFIYTDNMRWTEVDTIEDYVKAIKMVDKMKL